MTTKIEKVYPEYIRRDGGTQPRARIDPAVCKEYGERMQAGEKFPPVDVYFDGENYWLADGFHRVEAQVFALPGEAVDCTIHEGTLEDAQWHSYGANRDHGLRRTNHDKAQAVRSALTHRKGAGLSDEQVARHVGVTPPTIAKYRRELERSLKILESPKRTGQDGRTIDTKKIGNPGQKRGPRKAQKKNRGIASTPFRVKRGHSKPCPMIPIQLSPNNPQTAAATLMEFFPREFVQSLVQELTQRLSAEGEAA